MSSALDRFFEEENKREADELKALAEEKERFEKEKAEEDALRAKMGDDLYLQFKRLGDKDKRQRLLDMRQAEKRAKEEEEEERRREAAAALLKRNTKYYESTGCVYIGEHTNDADGKTFEPHGKGVYHWPDGDVMYEGEWLRGRRHGIGKYYWRNGDTFEGTFYKDNIHGSGSFTPATTGVPRLCIYRDNRRIAWLDDVTLGKRVEIKEEGCKYPGGLWRKATITKVISDTKREVSYDGTEATKRQRVDFKTAVFRFLDAEAPTYLQHVPIHEPPVVSKMPKNRRRSSASVAANPAAFSRSRGRTTGKDGPGITFTM